MPRRLSSCPRRMATAESRSRPRRSCSGSVLTVYRLIDTGELEAEQAKVTVYRRDGRVGQRRALRLRRDDIDDHLERARVKPGELAHLVTPGAGR